MKPHLNHEQQLELLRSRGLQVTDENDFMSFLERNNYYRLRGYYETYCSNLSRYLKLNSELRLPTAQVALTPTCTSMP